MTVAAEFEDSSTNYTKEEVEFKLWHLLLKSGETGFSAQIPDSAPLGGSITIDVTGIVDSENYDKISELMLHIHLPFLVI